MSLLEEALKQVKEDCGCGDQNNMSGGGEMSPNTLMTFLVKRNVADEEEVAEDPVGPGPEGEDSVDAQLKHFFKNKMSPSDDEVHELADKLGMEHDDLEERIYKMLHTLLGESVEPKRSKRTNFDTNIEKDTVENSNFRKVLFTTDKTQLVLMSLKPGEEIGMETHNGDQFFRFEKGEGKVIMNEKEVKVSDGSSATVREGTKHNVVNTSDTEDLKLYAIYSPPQHKDGTVDPSKPKGDEHE